MNEQPSLLPWIVSESEDRLELCHDHRWLAIVGIPLMLLGATAAIGLWFIPGIDHQDAWPMLAVGSLMGTGVITLGLHLSLNREIYIADRKQGQFIHHSGFSVFTRTRHFPLKSIQQVICDSLPGGTSFSLLLAMPKRNVLIARSVESDAIHTEGMRWAFFLSLPLVDNIAGHQVE